MLSLRAVIQLLMLVGLCTALTNRNEGSDATGDDFSVQLDRTISQIIPEGFTNVIGRQCFPFPTGNYCFNIITLYKEGEANPKGIIFMVQEGNKEDLGKLLSSSFQTGLNAAMIRISEGRSTFVNLNGDLA